MREKNRQRFFTRCHDILKISIMIPNKQTDSLSTANQLLANFLLLIFHCYALIEWQEKWKGMFFCFYIIYIVLILLKAKGKGKAYLIKV